MKCYYLTIVILIMLISKGCNIEVEKSDYPGVLRLNLQADPTDTSITILDKTYIPDTSSVMKVKVFEAKAYIDSCYTILLPTLDAFIDEGRSYDILKKDEGKYKRYKIYESYAPPGIYNRLQFGIIIKELEIGGYKIPIEVPEGGSLIYNFDIEFAVYEDDTTEINIQIKPFESLYRYRDSYIFNGNLEITSINVYRQK
ncbi:MAG: hypothetical protein H0Z29_09875 [Candidatus Marinimicrobia bacterium]|nr:hypothetical protein [Candidatus Neomarinimicrobiota bacterium]